MHFTPAELTRYAITAAVIILVLFLRLRNVGKTRRLRIETLWIVPMVFMGFAVFIFSQLPPSGLGWLWVAIAAVVGGVVGWQRGRFMEIRVDPDTHEINQKTSPAAIIFLVALVLVRMALRSAIAMGDARWHLGATLVTDIFIGFAIGVLTIYRVELYLRARRLLAEARSARP
jgi:membrane protein CcdC involved in cytochrome C biogenesis